MIVIPIKTKRIATNELTLEKLLEKSVKKFDDNSILAITSKIVSLCQGQVIPIGAIPKEQLIHKESQFYLGGSKGLWGINFTITNHTLIPSSGIDESNGDGVYILWPSRIQQTANQIRKYLQERFNVKNVGVLITDSTCTPLRLGTSGIFIAHSGFLATNDYRGEKDLFGRKFKVSQANVAGGLAAAAVVTMGEGAESTPLAVISDVPFVTFQARNPNAEELRELAITPEEDLFEPFLSRAQWKKGGST